MSLQAIHFDQHLFKKCKTDQELSFVLVQFNCSSHEWQLLTKCWSKFIPWGLILSNASTKFVRFMIHDRFPYSFCNNSAPIDKLSMCLKKSLDMNILDLRSTSNDWFSGSAELNSNYNARTIDFCEWMIPLQWIILALVQRIDKQTVSSVNYDRVD